MVDLKFQSWCGWYRWIRKHIRLTTIKNLIIFLIVGQFVNAGVGFYSVVRQSSLSESFATMDAGQKARTKAQALLIRARLETRPITENERRVIEGIWSQAEYDAAIIEVDLLLNNTSGAPDSKE